MKYLIFGLIILFGGWVQSLEDVADSNKFTYAVRGEIEGLLKGDTICFEKIDLPGWNLEPAVYVIVQEDGTFSFEGTAYHSQYFLMTYKPLSGKEVHADRRGVTLLLDSNVVLLKGNAEDIYYCEVNGGVYDHPSVQKIRALESKLGKERASYSKEVAKANASGDSEKAKEYVEKFNAAVMNSRTEYDQLSKMRTEFTTEYPSWELNIIESLQQISYTPVDQLEAYYASMDVQAQKSHYGILLKQEIDNMIMLAPGNDAPDFMLDAMDGQRIMLDDYAGSYLLIYHFGLCPGSLMVDREVTSFYLKNKDKVQVVGVTEDMTSIKSLFETVDPLEKMMDIELKPALESMTSHPWIDVENKGDNRQLAIDYAFAGLPFFVFISPDGKILSRGFQETFQEAKKIIEGNPE